MKISRQQSWKWGAIALVVIVLVTTLFAPANNPLQTGSTYNRNPDGYGAWYAYMQERGTPVKRWQKPFSDLTEFTQPTTLLQVLSSLLPPSLPPEQKSWVEQGNTLIILGVQKSVTAASFQTFQDSPFGQVEIHTTRRSKPEHESGFILGDRFGAVVWQQRVGDGRVIYSTTPFLAANAYQNSAGNFEFLAQLVSASGSNIWVDEYIHGYKDAEVIARDGTETAWEYLLKTPLFPTAIASLVVLLVAIWGANQRFGKARSLTSPKTDNSQAYIQALASVLYKAQSHEFIIETIGKDEQRQLQKDLGLGEKPLDSRALVDAWMQQTQHSPKLLKRLLNLQTKPKRLDDTQLLTWLQFWHKTRQLSQKDLNLKS